MGYVVILHKLFILFVYKEHRDMSGDRQGFAHYEFSHMDLGHEKDRSDRRA